jgi:hypothetical protein
MEGSLRDLKAFPNGAEENYEKLSANPVWVEISIRDIPGHKAGMPTNRSRLSLVFST